MGESVGGSGVFSGEVLFGSSACEMLLGLIFKFSRRSCIRWLSGLTSEARGDGVTRGRCESEDDDAVGVVGEG